MTAACPLIQTRDRGGSTRIGQRAADALLLEIETWPKPGLVSHVDSGAHRDMDAELLRASVSTLEPWFVELAWAGACGSGMADLRTIGIAAEAEMLEATGGVNTHRGAIFGMGLLAAAAGFREARGNSRTLGEIVAWRWGRSISAQSAQPDSHGGVVERFYGAGGARAEAAAGMPSVYRLALPALEEGRRLSGGGSDAARVHACMTLIAYVEDSNLLYRGGAEGLVFAQGEARRFLAAGSIGAPDWRLRAAAIHQRFIARRLSPGGCADLLGMALFVRSVAA